MIVLSFFIMLSALLISASVYTSFAMRSLRTLHPILSPLSVTRRIADRTTAGSAVDFVTIGAWTTSSTANSES
jgi:hypothetical protein